MGIERTHRIITLLALIDEAGGYDRRMRSLLAALVGEIYPDAGQRLVATPNGPQTLREYISQQVSQARQVQPGETSMADLWLGEVLTTGMRLVMAQEQAHLAHYHPGVLVNEPLEMWMTLGDVWWQLGQALAVPVPEAVRLYVGAGDPWDGEANI